MGPRVLAIRLVRLVAIRVAVKQVWRTDGVQGEAYDKFVVEREEVMAALAVAVWPDR